MVVIVGGGCCGSRSSLPIGGGVLEEALWGTSLIGMFFPDGNVRRPLNCMVAA